MLGHREWTWLATSVAMATLGFVAAGGCATSTFEPDDDDDGATGGAGGTTTPGGGGGTGGTTTTNTSMCDLDCSTITTPDCQVSVCNEGQHRGTVGVCVVVPDEDATPCEDGEFCTVQDACLAGVCIGGPENDCGITPGQCMEVYCDENSQSCGEQAAPPGAACQDPNDLCMSGATCNNGLCTGGTQQDCFFSPVPDDCHVSVCNPQNGQCEPVPGNEGQICTDINDLCTVGKTCVAGVCQGGSPMDCSSLTVGCFDGQCDTNTGLCIQVPIAPGQQCAEATDQCNVGICDTQGNCNPQPANQGQACDTDGCFVGQTCNNGTCQGGNQITACSNNDNCCPSGCDLNNDDDCGCEFALISNESQLTDSVITGLITANGHTFVNYNNNNSGVHTGNMGLLNNYQTIIFHEHDRVISSTEMNNLITWVQAGGRLLVTGYDSLGNPTDPNLASVVNCTGPGDGPFSGTLIVTNATHAIMLGPAQAFPLNMGLTAGSTDHDQCTPGPNAIKLVSVDSSSKLLVTDNVGSGNGRVIYWNGNGVTSGPLVDWVGTGGTQPDLQNLFVNVLDHMCQ